MPFRIIHDQIEGRDSCRSRRQLVAEDVDKVETKISDFGLKIFITSDVKVRRRRGNVASSSVSSLTYLPCVPVKLLCVTKVVGAPTLL